MERIREEAILENPIIAHEIKIGVCEGEPYDGFVVAFKGRCADTKKERKVSAIIPVDGITELIQMLFAAGVHFQEETGLDIGFSDVIREKKNE